MLGDILLCTVILNMYRCIWQAHTVETFFFTIILKYNSVRLKSIWHVADDLNQLLQCCLINGGDNPTLSGCVQLVYSKQHKTYEISHRIQLCGRQRKIKPFFEDFFSQLNIWNMCLSSNNFFQIFALRFSTEFLFPQQTM